MSALNEVFSSLVPLHMQESKSVLMMFSFTNFVKSQVRSLHTSALNEVLSSLVPLRGQESESVLTVICTK